MLVMRTIFRFAPALFFCGAALLGAPALAQQSGLGCPFPAPVNAACPGDTYPIGNGFCTLRCAPGEEQNPWDPHHCWKPVPCADGMRNAQNVCELNCESGMEENPFAPGSCRVAFSCPAEMTETADGVCSCPGERVEVAGNKCELQCLEGWEENPFDPNDCRVVYSCPAGLTETSERVCECPEEGHAECRLNLARQTLQDADCPEDETQAACLTEIAASRAEREFAVSPASLIPGFQRARELGLTGRGVTIGMEELGVSPYWVDDCVEYYLFASIVGDQLFWVGEGPRPVHRPDEEVPARYSSREECQEGLVRTHSDLPSIRVLEPGNSNPLPASQISPVPIHRFLIVQDGVDHVLLVLGVMAAQEDGYGVVGVAPGANYIYGRARTPALDWDETSASDAEIVNLSYGTSSNITQRAVLDIVPPGITVTSTMATRIGLMRNHTYLRQQLRHLEEMPEPADRRIYVRSGGNEFADNLQTGAGLPLYFPELRDNHLAVVAVENGQIASYSNRCGLAGADFCIAAPVGKWGLVADVFAGGILSPFDEDQFYENAYHRYPASGTSSAAPQVSGALALVKEYFNRMGGIGSHELVRRIKATADKSGVYADESIYGAGLLDLGNALSPVGALRLRSGESVWDGEGVLLSESEFFSGVALGDSAGRALRGMTLAAFDDLHAPFPISSEMVLRESSRARLGGLGSHLRRWQVGDAGSGAFSFSAFRDGSAWWSLNAPGDSHFEWDEGVGSGGEDSPAVFSDWVGNPYSDLAGRGLVAGSSFRLSGGNGFRMAMFGESLGNEKRFRGVLAEFSFSPFSDGWGEGEGSRWFAQAGGVREYSGLLASSGSGLFSDLRSRTAFAGLGFAGGFSDGWRYRLGAHWGRTSAEGGAWLTATDSLRSGSYAADLERSDVLRSGDGLGFRVRQPLRVSGGLRFRVPTGRTKYGELTWSEVSGTPSGRELEWEARYRRGDESGRWGVSAVLVSESGHRSGAKTEGRALFAFERAF